MMQDGNGTSASQPFEVNSEKIAIYAELTDDFNPIHMDAEFAAGTEFGDVIAHGTMSVNLIWQALEEHLGRAVAEKVNLEVKFVKPVRNKDVLSAKILSNTSPDADVAIHVVTQNQEVVIFAEARGSEHSSK